MATMTFPDNWQIGKDFDPNEHLMDLKGRSYLGVQHRLLWFIRDQRALIVAGRATMPYILRTELLEHDREAGFAQFRTYVRDVLGNEATMYGSETAKDFGDYVEKASTKSLGRALVLLGYGTASAPEMDEGERVVDSPVERATVVRTQQQPRPIRPAPQAKLTPVPSKATWPGLRLRARKLNITSEEDWRDFVVSATGKVADFTPQDLVTVEQKLGRRERGEEPGETA